MNSCNHSWVSNVRFNSAVVSCSICGEEANGGYIAHLKSELTAAKADAGCWRIAAEGSKAEAERLRGRVSELSSRADALSYAIVHRLEDEQQESFTKQFAALQDAIVAQSSEPFILRKRADAVERFGQEIGVFDPEYDDQEYVEIPRREVKAYAQRLRNQADELEAGGTHD